MSQPAGFCAGVVQIGDERLLAVFGQAGGVRIGDDVGFHLARRGRVDRDLIAVGGVLPGGVAGHAPTSIDPGLHRHGLGLAVHGHQRFDVLCGGGPDRQGRKAARPGHAQRPAVAVEVVECAPALHARRVDQFVVQAGAAERQLPAQGRRHLARVLGPQLDHRVLRQIRIFGLERRAELIAVVRAHQRQALAAGDARRGQLEVARGAVVQVEQRSVLQQRGLDGDGVAGQPEGLLLAEVADGPHAGIGPGGVDRGAAADDPGLVAGGGGQALVGAGVFVVAVVDDEVQFGPALQGGHVPVHAEVIFAGLRQRFGPLGGRFRAVPDVQAPAVVLAVGAVVVDAGVACRNGRVGAGGGSSGRGLGQCGRGHHRLGRVHVERPGLGVGHVACCPI